MRGVIENIDSVEICCEVSSPDGTPVMIVRVVPEGTVVKQGDVLVEFDSSTLEA